jgi:hypothetical protein
MASWGLILALSGFSYGFDGGVEFEPRIRSDDFKCFWSTGRAWGVYEQKMVDSELKKVIKVLHGSL